MTAVLLALLSAVGYGALDFLAGVASRRLPYVRVAVVVQCVGAVVVLLALPSPAEGSSGPRWHGVG